MQTFAATDKWPTQLYKSLPLSSKRASIRLLRLHAGAWDDPLCCDLFRTALIASDSYDALSYTWGDANQQTGLAVNGVRAIITINLDHALRGLYFVDRNRCVWVDALCINQQDNAERSAQVQQMSMIYRSATRVVIWLGVASSTSPIAFRYLR